MDFEKTKQIPTSLRVQKKIGRNLNAVRHKIRMTKARKQEVPYMWPDLV